MRNVYDDAKIPLKAKVTGTPVVVAKIKEVKFIVTLVKDGVETAQAPVTAPVVVGFPDSTATASFQLTPVDDTLDSYEVKYKAEIAPVGKPVLTVDGEEEFRVWPSKVALTFTSDAGDAHKKAKFHIVKDSVDSPVKTAGDDGKWSERVGQSAFQVKAGPLYELVDPITHKGKARTYKIKKNAYNVEFVSPTVADPTLTTKQYVNLDVDTKGWSEEKPFGHVLTFTVGAEGDVARKPEAKLGKQNDIVFIEVNFTFQTKRNNPQPKLLPDGLDGVAVASNTDKTWKGQVKLGAKGQATFKVELGLAGGDICEVKVGADSTCAGPSLKFENWRRLFYELMYGDIMTPELKDVGDGKFDYPDGIKNLVDPRLAAVNIEYVRVASHKFTKTQAKKGTVVPAAYVSLAGRDRVIMGGKLPADPPVPFGTPNDRTIHVRLCDRTFSTNGVMKPESPDVDSTDYDFSNGKNFIPLEVDVTGCEWEAQIANPATYLDDATVAFETADTADVVNKPYVISVHETLQNKKLDLTFVRNSSGVAADTLSVSEEAKIDPFVLSVLDVAKLKEHGNAVKFKIGRPTATPQDAARHDLVKNALQASFDTQKPAIYSHPGLNNDGTARTGPVLEAWFVAHKCDVLKIKLPTSPGGTKALPGDLVDAAESATKCPIKVNFSVYSSGGINGNSGSGKQLFQMKPPPRTPGAMASTLCHELGHSMGMTIMANKSKIPPGMDPALHVDSSPTKGPYYKNGASPYTNGIRNIGVGAHCSHGIGNTVHATFNGATGSCILFHEGGDADTRTAYCAVCIGYLRARNLTNIVKGWWKDDTGVNWLRPNPEDY